MAQSSYPPPKSFQDKAYIQSLEQYKEMYQRSIDSPEEFWAEIAEQFYWKKPWDNVRAFDFTGDVSIKWFEGAQTNITYNALDRHVENGRKDQTAILWEGNDLGEDSALTYGELLDEVCRFSNALKAQGVQKGDVVSIYMPMITELAIAVLACARIGAIHSVVFGGFSADSLANRINDAKCETLITADGCFRGKKPLGLKQIADDAVQICKDTYQHDVKRSIVVKRAGDKIPCEMTEGRDVWWHDIVDGQSTTCEPEWMDAEDPLFILYTSGSTGKPKGVVHTVGGYMVYTTTTFKYVFDYHDGDIYWCTADIGWITGHSYIVYGPLCAGATTVMFEGVPTHPDPGRFWDVVDKYKVNIFYTAPTAIRALERYGDEHVEKRDLSSLRLLGSVGEPINEEAWLWYHKVVGKENCPIIDTWWQTETGGILITPLPGAVHTKPGKATLPFFGVKPAIVDEEGNIKEGPCEGILTMLEPWPSMMRTVYGDHERFKNTYFSMFKGKYFTGDGCNRDEDGYYRITGRVDDVINVSGHRMGTAEVESALDSHTSVVEAAVVGYPHDIKGQGIYAYVTLLPSVQKTDELIQDLRKHVRKEIGPIATPDVIHFADALPKTRSGKIMRRILRKIAANELDRLGDTSTLADPSVVDVLIDNRPLK
ncbi:MAG: acetate--CoA ligase [Deltaproteobacteria bacterium]|nr:acetate--CoA ligase [Deltaproteobacteria bacterium]|tara:strand:+ start:2881 stop:4842 length:1962 start_codon:yes stop_codon:yes gene_type:complete